MKTTSLTINTNEINKLKDFITENNFRELTTKSEYELLRIKDGEINIVLYKSGKLVHNGSISSKNIINSILEREKAFDFIIGSDETGKGEWYGPLVVVATALSSDDILLLRRIGVKDSKTIKKHKLIELAKKLRNMSFARHSITLMPETYNELYSKFKKENKNLNDLMAWAHSTVIQSLLEKIEFNKAKVIIDKFDFEKTEYRLKNIDKTNLKIIQKSGAESETAVAAASIIAKYIFETEIEKLNRKYGINLKQSKPEDIDTDIIAIVAKKHFKNVKNV
jgi:ribonuclease HIII